VGVRPLTIGYAKRKGTKENSCLNKTDSYKENITVMFPH
jgi:hypothetical protein